MRYGIYGLLEGKQVINMKDLKILFWMYLIGAIILLSLYSIWQAEDIKKNVKNIESLQIKLKEIEYPKIKEQIEILRTQVNQLGDRNFKQTERR